VSSAAEPRGRYRWLICLLLFLATTVNYFDRQILSLLKPILDHELGWSNEEFGRVNAAFQLMYALGFLLFGVLVDRLGSKIGYALSIAAWSLAALSHSLATSVSGFINARMALGFGESGNFPSAIKAVALWFPKRERAFATALFNAGANVGAIVAPGVVPWLAYNWGWRSAFVAAGIAGLFWLGLWLPFYDTPERVKRITASELELIRSDSADTNVATPARPSWAALLRERGAWAFIVAKFLTDPVWWFFLTWLPDYFKKTRGMDLKQSWMHLMSIYVIVTVLSIIGGWIPGQLVRRGQTVNRARKLSMLIFAILVVPVLGVTKVDAWPAVFLIGLAGAAHQAWSANLFTTVSDMFPKQAVARVVGMGGTAGSIGGMLFPIYAGKLLDTFTRAHNVTAGYAILFSICGSAYLVAFGLNHVLAPRFERASV
jgi:ACS family hexuronate transporter-like MFS transporter